MRQRSALETLDEAVALLRALPAGSYACYLTGAVPFSLAVLYFGTDMTRNPFAAERLPVESLGLAALLIWKSVWQAVFELRVYESVALSSPRRLNIARIIGIQAAVQPFGLVVLPVMLILGIPFAASVAFFRYVGLLVALDQPDAVRSARQQAQLWNRQNWFVLAFVSLGGLVLFANILLTMILLPQLGKSFLGIEGDLARLGLGLLNFTTVGVAAAITWFVVDPLIDVIYAVRLFHTRSLATGEDLRVELRKAIGAVALAIALLVIAMPEVRAQDREGVHQAITIDPQRLDQSIQDVIRKPEFAWRTPRPPGPEPQGRWVNWIRSAFDTLNRWADWLVDRIRSWFRRPTPEDEVKKPKGGERPPIELWMIVAGLALAGIAIAVFRGRQAPRKVQAVPEGAGAAVNVAEESVTADQLPESSWLQLADELLRSGDYRLAIRALHLAGLNYLSGRGLISIERWKTGSDYRRELERKVRAQMNIDPGLTPLFRSNVTLFERGWYGFRSLDAEEVMAFAKSVEAMKNYAGRA